MARRSTLNALVGGVLGIVNSFGVVLRTLGLSAL